MTDIDLFAQLRKDFESGDMMSIAPLADLAEEVLGDTPETRRLRMCADKLIGTTSLSMIVMARLMASLVLQELAKKGSVR